MPFSAGFFSRLPRSRLTQCSSQFRGARDLAKRGRRDNADRLWRPVFAARKSHTLRKRKAYCPKKLKFPPAGGQPTLNTYQSEHSRSFCTFCGSSGQGIIAHAQLSARVQVWTGHSRLRGGCFLVAGGSHSSVFQDLRVSAAAKKKA